MVEPSWRGTLTTDEPVSTDPAVDVWFAELDHPLKPAMQRVREILLGAAPELREIVQYGTIQFVCVSGMCAFVQVKDTRQVSLMFNAAGRLKGAFPCRLAASPTQRRQRPRRGQDTRTRLGRDEQAGVRGGLVIHESEVVPRGRGVLVGHVRRTKERDIHRRFRQVVPRPIKSQQANAFANAWRRSSAG
jgi:Domain of unknown function (DU1801)